MKTKYKLEQLVECQGGTRGVVDAIVQRKDSVSYLLKDNAEEVRESDITNAYRPVKTGPRKPRAAKDIKPAKKSKAASQLGSMSQ